MTKTESKVSVATIVVALALLGVVGYALAFYFFPNMKKVSNKRSNYGYGYGYNSPRK
jgi:hypothetical protein